MHSAHDFQSPRDRRLALEAAGYNWRRVLTDACLDQAVAPASWGTHQTLRAWLADGAYRPDVARKASVATTIFPLVCQGGRRLEHLEAMGY